MKERSISVIIPTYYPDASFRSLLERMMKQTVLPCEILVVNTEQEGFSLTEQELPKLARVIHIRKEEFNHGGTRDMAARLARGDLLVFLTMDAMPADTHLLEQLSLAFSREDVAVVYGRQLPRKDASFLEQRTREYNYGPQSRHKTKEDIPKLGIKTFFCSNVCAAYRRDRYLEVGGFERRVIFNEDMIFAHKLIMAGYAVQYCAEARVIHSHDYSALQQFHRNFDLGVSQAEHPEVFAGISSETEGLGMLRRLAGELVHSGRGYLIFPLFFQSGMKYLGYRLGKAYRRLPGWLVRRCSMNPDYWKQKTT